MQNEFGNILDRILLLLTQFLSILKAKAAPMVVFLSNLTGLSQQTLLWVLPMVLILLVLTLLVLKRILRKKPKINDEPSSMHRETEIPDAIKPVEEMDRDQAPLTEPVVYDPQHEIEHTGFLTNIRTGLSKTRKALSSRVDKLFSMGSGLDEDMLEELEELLITSDVGVETSMKLIESLSGKSSEIQSAEDLKKAIKEDIFSIIDVKTDMTLKPTAKPHVVMVVGVNGVGKTTTLGKLASRFVSEGKNVLIVAADTFRAAASDQLAVWAERSGADIVRHKDNSDPAAVAFDGMEAALARKMDIVLIDTAGRLHTKKNLMEELKKIKRTVASKLPGAPQETLMVVDGTTGQNALQQAKLFNDAIGISSIALTKLDGTAKGGIVIGISHALNVPLKYIGVGEQVGDLQDFDPKEFADAIL